MAEVWALCDGLTFAKEENVKNLEIEIDETNHCADVLANDSPVLVGDLQKKKLSTIIPLSRPLFTRSPLSLHLLHPVGGYDSTGPLYSGNYGVYCIAKGWFQSSISSLGP